MKYGAITTLDATVLDDVFAQFKGQQVKVLEIGVYHGDTARGMKAACEANQCTIQYHGIDAFPMATPIPPIVGGHYVVSESAEAFDFVPGELDVVFVDGCHCLNHVILDAIHYSRKVKANGFMVFHDTAPQVQGVQTNHWVHGTIDKPLHRTQVRKALELIGWPNAQWQLWRDRYEPEANIGGMMVFKRAL